MPIIECPAPDCGAMLGVDDNFNGTIQHNDDGSHTTHHGAREHSASSPRDMRVEFSHEDPTKAELVTIELTRDGVFNLCADLDLDAPTTRELAEALAPAITWDVAATAEMHAQSALVDRESVDRLNREWERDALARVMAQGDLKYWDVVQVLNGAARSLLALRAVRAEWLDKTDSDLDPAVTS